MENKHVDRVEIALVIACIVLAAAGLQSCGKGAIKDGDFIEEDAGAFFERHDIGVGNYHILVEKSTGICYLEYGAEGKNNYAVTVMLNEDGTPKIWNPEEWQTIQIIEDPMMDAENSTRTDK